MEKFDVQNLVELNNNLVASINALTNVVQLLKTSNDAFVKEVANALEHIQNVEAENDKLEDENHKMREELINAKSTNAKAAMEDFKNDN